MFVARYLCADAIVGDGAIDDVLVMKRLALWLCAVVIDEVCPFLGIFLEAFITELLEKRLVELIDVDNGNSILKLRPELCQLQGLLLIVRQVEGATEILVSLRFGEFYLLNINCRAVIEFHSFPPFLWQ